MFGWKWTSDGQWHSEPEPRPGETAVQLPPAKREWVKRGFFNDKPMPRHEVALKASNARMWLENILYDGPMGASEVLRLAKAERIPERALRRAKRHLKVKSLRRGGKGTGRRNPWIWQTPVSD
jgi:hypothetical protein